MLLAEEDGAAYCGVLLTVQLRGVAQNLHFGPFAHRVVGEREEGSGDVLRQVIFATVIADICRNAIDDYVVSSR